MLLYAKSPFQKSLLTELLSRRLLFNNGFKKCTCTRRQVRRRLPCYIILVFLTQSNLINIRCLDGIWKNKMSNSRQWGNKQTVT